VLYVISGQKVLCDTFIDLARRTWAQMERNHLTKILVDEEGITGVNLQELKIKHPYQVQIFDFTPHEESKRTGADWEWWFVDGAYAMGFAVQAKRLDRGKYDVGYKPKNNPLQIETLLRYCSIAGDISPLYCWYNYFHDENAESDFWGCALADGVAVYEKHMAGKYKLTDIKPISRPWHRLVCHFLDSGIESVDWEATSLASKIANPAIVLPSGVSPVSPTVHKNGLPQRVKNMINSKGKNGKLILTDPPTSYPGRIVIVQRAWPRSDRFD
jgi:hypothetical protein